jgi:uncharacterized protein YbaA (DUF1428 family)
MSLKSSTIVKEGTHMPTAPQIANAGYVNVWVGVLPKDKIEEFLGILKISAQVMRDCGALAVVDSVGEDIPHGKLTSFPRALLMKEGGNEVVWCQQTYYRSKAESEVTDAKYMEDPRIAGMANMTMPYDGKRVFYAGFEIKAIG